MAGEVLRTLKELSRSYRTINKDLTRTLNRLQPLYRSGSTIVRNGCARNRAVAAAGAVEVRASPLYVK